MVSHGVSWCLKMSHGVSCLTMSGRVSRCILSLRPILSIQAREPGNEASILCVCVSCVSGVSVTPACMISIHIMS